MNEKEISELVKEARQENNIFNHLSPIAQAVFLLQKKYGNYIFKQHYDSRAYLLKKDAYNNYKIY